MPDRVKCHRMTEEAYLEAEEKATVRHEYVDGHVFAMTGATVAHNIIQAPRLRESLWPACG